MEERRLTSRASTSDLGPAVMACDFALVVWAIPSDVILLANQAAADLFALPLDRLVGSRGFDLGGPREAVESTVAALDSGGVVDVLSERWIKNPGGRTIRVRVWSKAIDLDGKRAAVSLVVPDAEVERLGRDPATPWRELTAVAVGSVDREWRIERVSKEFHGLLGMHPAGSVGLSLLNLIDPDDVPRVLPKAGEVAQSIAFDSHVRFRDGSGSWVELCVLLAPLTHEGCPTGSMAFALVGTPPRFAPSAPDRVAELEMLLRHIGARMRAAGVLDDIDGLPTAHEYPQLGELTTRQWEILRRLLRGDRVPTIAKQLFVSPSTVRNHLSAIFGKFGVHSQPELLAKLRAPSPDASSASSDQAVRR